MVFELLVKNEEILALLEKGNENLGVLGYTDHSLAHCMLVAERAANILKLLGYDEAMQEKGKIAGLMHDIGNAVNRSRHAESGALLAFEILKEYPVSLKDRIEIVSAIGNHDESTGGAKDILSAAVILADKSDVRRNRVRDKEKSSFDIHDRVNYAVTGTNLKVDGKIRKISLNLQIDSKICTMVDYFDIFLGRMMMCCKAAEVLNATFHLTVNGIRML